MQSIKLSQWAKDHGLSYSGALRMYTRGDLPTAYRLSTGTILVKLEDPPKPTKVAVYSRVSSQKQKPDLDRQTMRLVDFCIANGWVVDEIRKEVASGLNDNRRELLKLMDSDITKLVVEHKDRLTRFGFNYLERYFKLRGCDIVVVNKAETDRDDLMSDFVSVVTSMCARLYGLRRNRRRTEKIIAELKHD